VTDKDTSHIIGRLQKIRTDGADATWHVVCSRLWRRGNNSDYY